MVHLTIEVAVGLANDLIVVRRQPISCTSGGPISHIFVNRPYLNELIMYGRW